MKQLLLVDDDTVFCHVLAQALSHHGFSVSTAHTAAEAAALAPTLQPEYAILDLKMPGDSGLTLIPALLAADPYTKILILTGYASIATAIEAVKLGAVHYLAKPASTEAILAAFEKQTGDPTIPVESPGSLTEVEWRHIKTTLDRHQGNISATARALGMHRRTLQRKLQKSTFAPSGDK